MQRQTRQLLIATMVLTLLISSAIAINTEKRNKKRILAKKSKTKDDYVRAELTFSEEDFINNNSKHVPVDFKSTFDTNEDGINFRNNPDLVKIYNKHYQECYNEIFLPRTTNANLSQSTHYIPFRSIAKTSIYQKVILGTNRYILELTTRISCKSIFLISESEDIYEVYYQINNKNQQKCDGVEPRPLVNEIETTLILCNHELNGACKEKSSFKAKYEKPDLKIKNGITISIDTTNCHNHKEYRKFLKNGNQPFENGFESLGGNQFFIPFVKNLVNGVKYETDKAKNILILLDYRTDITEYQVNSHLAMMTAKTVPKYFSVSFNIKTEDFDILSNISIGFKNVFMSLVIKIAEHQQPIARLTDEEKALYKNLLNFVLNVDGTKEPTTEPAKSIYDNFKDFAAKHLLNKNSKDAEAVVKYLTEDFAKRIVNQ